jgi:aromatic-L-amino-acid decarboxylase
MSTVDDTAALGAVLATLDEAQRLGVGDMDTTTFRAAAHRVVDLMADYLAGIEAHPVLPPIAPGHVREQLPAGPPEAPEPLASILADYQAIIEPNMTNWQHPGFLAYFPSTASAPGILAEMLVATLVGNAMLWRTSPAATELEQVTVAWLRDGLGLPPEFDGMYNDTASTSSLIALAAARQRSTGDAAASGLAGQARLRVYGSPETHSSIEKACMTLGIGRAGFRRVSVGSDAAMEPAALRAAVDEDRAAGWLPSAVVATLGTTGSTAIDPVAAIADVAAAEGLWLHVDAAYAGVVALIPERRAPFVGWERADSIVVNPHKWLFTPFDCSLLLTRQMPVMRDAFSLVPEYLRSLDQTAGRDYNEYIPQLGRRFRALKIWFVVRYFGLEGLRRRLAAHIALADRFRAHVEAEPDAQILAATPFSTVCFRWRPRAVAGREGEVDVASVLDHLNEELMRAMNASGEVFLSHARLDGRLALRVSIGGLRTEPRHVDRTWALVVEHGRRLAGDAMAEIAGRGTASG